MNHGPCQISAAACQRGIDHMYRVEFGFIGWVFHLLGQLVGDAFMAMIVIVLGNAALTALFLLGFRWVMKRRGYL